MKKSLGDLLRLLLPMGVARRRLLKRLASHVTKEELRDIRYLAKMHKIGLHEERFGAVTFDDQAWPQLTPGVEEKELHDFTKRINVKVKDAIQLACFKGQRSSILSKITGIVAPNIVGFDAIKEAAALQLFAQEPVHILLLGDPGTGKTEILRGMERLAPHAVFGLGSGASKAGLIGSYAGKEFKPGLLVEANDGLALIDELNLLKKEDRAGLYSAMEKGFITYDKRGKHERHDARIRVLATANPKGDKFIGRDIKFLTTQLPFDDALLSRFHLLFLVRKAKGKELEEITRKIVKNDVHELEDGDARFVQEYVTYAEKLSVAFDDTYESMIVNFIEELKRDESNLLVEVGPRTVIGVIRLAKAYARARLSRSTSADDIEAAMKLMKAAFESPYKKKENHEKKERRKSKSV